MMAMPTSPNRRLSEAGHGETDEGDGAGGADGDQRAHGPGIAQLGRLARLDDDGRYGARTDHQRDGEGHDQTLEPPLRIAAHVLAVGEGVLVGEHGQEVAPRHVQTQEQQQNAARDAEGRQGNPEELQQAQAGEQEEGQEDGGEGADQGRDRNPLTQGRPRRGRGEDGQVADRVQQGEQGHEQVDTQIDRVHRLTSPLKPVTPARPTHPLRPGIAAQRESVDDPKSLRRS
jgi:hypothetical protein